MSPAELKTARHELGLSAQAFARLIGVHDGRTVRRWESGDAPIPGLLPLFLHMRAVIAKLVPADFDQHPDDFMPEWHEAKKVLELPKSGLTPRA
jgi:transcriptional regulator with XRE-family HTH domain